MPKSKREPESEPEPEEEEEEEEEEEDLGPETFSKWRKSGPWVTDGYFNHWYGVLEGKIKHAKHQLRTELKKFILEQLEGFYNSHGAGPSAPKRSKSGELQVDMHEFQAWQGKITHLENKRLKTRSSKLHVKNGGSMLTHLKNPQQCVRL
ncbi:hypothetical protein CYMTET_56771 [Cymbomonas tetramitiformis]|uniref:Uncharacterized protein n=1 Tax=Cymbomonas tetramitiformis TaxID=36881 RepID=A0AAE0BBR6_9CHLO|nr:hypothetical protein CYMTET_56771 [Cymbomonas tetramitiformis]